MTKYELRRLADSVAGLAKTINEIISGKVQGAARPATQVKPPWAPQDAIQVRPYAPLLTKPQVAAFFQVTTRTIDYWQAGRYLPYYKIGRAIRFKPSDIQRYLDENLKPSRS